MKTDLMMKIIDEKVKIGWNFDRIYNHLLIIDDLQKINKDATLSNENTVTNFDEKSSEKS